MGKSKSTWVFVPCMVGYGWVWSRTRTEEVNTIHAASTLQGKTGKMTLARPRDVGGFQHMYQHQLTPISSNWHQSINNNVMISVSIKKEDLSLA